MQTVRANVLNDNRRRLKGTTTAKHENVLDGRTGRAAHEINSRGHRRVIASNPFKAIV